MNFLVSVIEPLESTKSLKPSLAPLATIISLVIPNSFNLSISPVIMSKTASVACSKGLPILAAKSPTVPITSFGSNPLIESLTVDSITS